MCTPHSDCGAVTGMSKFGGNDWLLALNHPNDTSTEKDAISDAASCIARRIGIGFDRRFSNRGSDQSKVKRHYKLFRETNSVCLAKVRMDDKLIIAAHADSLSLAGMTGVVLAGYLAGCGLVEVGLITLRSCSSGCASLHAYNGIPVGGFLQQLSDALADRHVAHGWIKGYMGSSITSDDGRETITAAGGEVLEGDQRFRIVRSRNCPFARSFGTRYLHAGVLPGYRARLSA